MFEVLDVPVGPGVKTCLEFIINIFIMLVILKESKVYTKIYEYEILLSIYAD